MGYNSLTLDSRHSPLIATTTTTFLFLLKVRLLDFDIKQLRRPGTDLSLLSRARLRRSHLVRSETKALENLIAAVKFMEANWPLK